MGIVFKVGNIAVEQSPCYGEEYPDEGWHEFQSPQYPRSLFFAIPDEEKKVRCADLLPWEIEKED